MKIAFLKFHPSRAAGLLGTWLLGSLVATGCHSDPAPATPASLSPATATYPATVAQSWLTLELRLARTTPVVAANTFGRPFGYAGIAGYEAAVAGMPDYHSLVGQLNGLAGLPTADPALAYCWPLSANAALAAVNRTLFANTSAANLATIDSLEAANQATNQAGLDAATGPRSVEYGRRVAAAVLAWASTDGALATPVPYPLPTGPGLWVPTPPAFAPANSPLWGQNRTLVAGSGDEADPGPPLAYSEAPGSPFQLMAREVMDVAQARTPDQTAIALFWNDAPNGRSFTAPGHWVSILAQVVAKENPPLDRALLASAKLGICLNDALISAFRAKYTYNQLRPVTYIRGPLGQPTWSPLIVTPNFPEYTAAHAVTSAAAAEALGELFGPAYAFTDQGYVPFGLAARSYPSFEAAATEAGLSRLYGGIHYRPSVEKGLVQGRKVAQAINAKLTF